MTSAKVNIRPLKEWALNLPKNSVLRDLLLGEPDELQADEALILFSVWLKLIRRKATLSN